MKQDKVKILLVVLLVLFLSYFLWDVWGRQKNSWVFQGYAIAIAEIIDVANNPQCEPFPLRIEDESVELINIECLMEASEEGATE